MFGTVDSVIICSLSAASHSAEQRAGTGPGEAAGFSRQFRVGCLFATAGERLMSHSDWLLKIPHPLGTREGFLLQIDCNGNFRASASAQLLALPAGRPG